MARYLPFTTGGFEVQWRTIGVSELHGRVMLPRLEAARNGHTAIVSATNAGKRLERLLTPATAELTRRRVRRAVSAATGLRWLPSLTRL